MATFQAASVVEVVEESAGALVELVVARIDRVRFAPTRVDRG